MLIEDIMVKVISVGGNQPITAKDGKQIDRMKLKVEHKREVIYKGLPTNKTNYYTIDAFGTMCQRIAGTEGRYVTISMELNGTLSKDQSTTYHNLKLTYIN